MPDDAEDLLAIAMGPWAARAVHVAATIGLPDHLDRGPRTVAELAECTGSRPVALGQLLRLLAALDVVRAEDGRYGLGRLGRLLVAEAPGSMRDLVLLYGEEFGAAWDALPAALRDGGSGFRHAHGQEMYEYLADHPDTAVRFDRTMAFGERFVRALPTVRDFSAASLVVDVGGGTGHLLAGFLREHPGTRGILLEVDHVAAHARRYLAGAGLDDRSSVVVGDLVAGVPTGGDVYLLSRVLHGRTDDECVRIAGRCREAMAEGGEVIVVERTIPDDGSSTPALWFDVHILAVTGGGERTGSAYAEILRAAGLEVTEVHPLASGFNALVARAVPSSRPGHGTAAATRSMTAAG